MKSDKGKQRGAALKKAARRLREEIRSRKPSRETVRRFSADLVYIVISCCVGAFSLTAVLLPNGLSSGGVTGIVRILQKVVSLDFSVLFYIATAVIVLLVAVFLGWREVRKVLLVSAVFPAVLVVFEQLNFQLLEEKDVILAAIFCGIFGGISSGIIFFRGYSFAGTDAIAKIIRKRFFPYIGLSQILLVIDAVIIAASAFIFGRNIALYALITQLIFAKTVDFVIYGFETKTVQVEIITDRREEISGYIMNEIRRGVSSIDITGEYTRQSRPKLVVICSPRESILIKRFVAKTDRDAFVTVIHVETVWGRGEGFSDIQNE